MKFLSDVVFERGCHKIIFCFGLLRTLVKYLLEILFERDVIKEYLFWIMENIGGSFIGDTL